MRQCPSDVPGAKVTAADVDGGIVIRIVGPDDAAEAQIRERASALVNAKLGEEGPRPHTQHPGGGHHGCAERIRGTQRNAADIPGGTAFTLSATDPAEVARVRAEVRERLAPAP
jgi:hypothetical protein